MSQRVVLQEDDRDNEISIARGDSILLRLGEEYFHASATPALSFSLAQGLPKIKQQHFSLSAFN